jgi:hypothetical protein
MAIGDDSLLRKSSLFLFPEFRVYICSSNIRSNLINLCVYTWGSNLTPDEKDALKHGRALLFILAGTI